MSETFAIPQIKQVQVKQAQPNLQFLRVIPGILLLAAIGYARKIAGTKRRQIRQIPSLDLSQY